MSGCAAKPLVAVAAASCQGPRKQPPPTCAAAAASGALSSRRTCCHAEELQQLPRRRVSAIKGTQESLLLCDLLQIARHRAGLQQEMSLCVSAARAERSPMAYRHFSNSNMRSYKPHRAGLHLFFSRQSKSRRPVLMNRFNFQLACLHASDRHFQQLQCTFTRQHSQSCACNLVACSIHKKEGDTGLADHVGVQ